ncbi:MAG TPA: hypothetical protein VH877_01305 [Polyangia bacterium]|nr:hypothetical protein [Polyangia bacterium]
MTPSDDDLLDEIDDAFLVIIQGRHKRSFNQQKRAYEAWLAKYIPQLEARGLGERSLRMRRLVAKWLLAEAAEKNRPASAFEPLLRDLEVLGWNRLDQKVDAIALMCQYFAVRMWKRDGLRHLRAIRREVMQELARTGEELWAGKLRWLDEIERWLRVRGRPS